MLWNCFINFAVADQIGCRATEPNYARNIDAIEIWLIGCGFKNVPACVEETLYNLAKLNTDLKFLSFI